MNAEIHIWNAKKNQLANRILNLLPKSQGTVSNFYGTEIEIWAGFGPVGNTEVPVC